MTEALPDPLLIARISTGDGSACAHLSLKKLDSRKIFIWIEQKMIKLAHRLQKDNMDWGVRDLREDTLNRCSEVRTRTHYVELFVFDHEVHST